MVSKQVSKSELTRVTQALGYFQTEPLVAWRMRVGNREANAIGKKAMTIGTRVHEILASNNFMPEKSDSKPVRNCLLGFLKWKNRYDPHHDQTFIHYQEKDRLTDEKIGLTGCPDYFWVEQSELIDFKCGKNIYPNYFFQLGGYKRLGIKAKKGSILRLDPESADYEYVSNEDMGISMESCVDAFESAFKHYKYYTHLESKLGDKS